MSGGRPMLPTWDSLTKEAFLSLIEDGGSYAIWRGYFQRKPRVRVKAERGVS